MFMTGGVFAAMFGNAISGLILEHLDLVGGLRGWQWVFLLGGMPAVLLGFITLYYLTDRPEQAQWLTSAERSWLAEQIERERAQTGRLHGSDLWAAMIDPRVWLLIAIYFTVAMGDNSYGFFIPSFMKSQFSDWTASQLGLIAAVPSIAAMIAMLVVGRHSDRTGERRWHVAGSAFLASSGWLLVALAPSPWLFVIGAAIATAGMKSMLPTFWTLPPMFLTGAAAAGASP